MGGHTHHLYHNASYREQLSGLYGLISSSLTSKPWSIEVCTSHSFINVREIFARFDGLHETISDSMALNF
jgi:hypothetical protein